MLQWTANDELFLYYLLIASEQIATKARCSKNKEMQNQTQIKICPRAT